MISIKTAAKPEVKPASTPNRKGYKVKHPEGVLIACPDCGIDATGIYMAADKEGNRKIAPSGGLVQHYRHAHSSKSEAMRKGEIALVAK